MTKKIDNNGTADSSKGKLSLWVEKVLPEGSFLRKISLLGGASGIGQVIVMVVSPILTRLYTTGDFGILAVYSSLIGILAVAVALRYDIAIPIPNRSEHAANLFVLAFVAVFIVTSIFGMGLWLFRESIANSLDSPEFANYIWLVPIGLLGTGIYQTLKYWALRTKAYSVLSKTKIIQGIASATSQVGIGFLGLGPVGLIIGNILGRSAGAGSLMRLFKKELALLDQVNFKRVFSVARNYKNFPFISVPGALLNNAGVHMPVFLLAVFFGPGVTGLYALADRVIKAPVNIVGKATQEVYIGEASELLRNDPDSLIKLYKETAFKLFLIGIIPAILAFSLGPYAFDIIFGNNWRTAGLYVRILSPMLLLRFVTSPLIHTLNILERQGTLMVWEGSRLLLIVGALWMGYLLALNDITTMMLYSGAATLSYAFVHMLNFYVLRDFE